MGIKIEIATARSAESDGQPEAKGVFNEELGAVVVGRTTMLTLCEPVEHGWRFEKIDEAMPLQAA